MIADGHHVDPLVLELVRRTAGDRVVLVSDSTPAAAAAAGGYVMAGVAIERVPDGTVRTADGRLAGGSLTLDEAVRSWRAMTGASLAEAIRAASEVPGTAIGLNARLEPGAPANVVLLDRRASSAARCSTAAGRAMPEEPGSYPDRPLAPDHNAGRTDRDLLAESAVDDHDRGQGEARDDIHVHAGGQGVWAARSAGELGAEPILCGLIGGETGAVLEPLLERLPGHRRLVHTETASGCLVFDRRSGEREVVAAMNAQPPSRHELDDLFSLTCAVALEASALVICNPYRRTAGRSTSTRTSRPISAPTAPPVLVDLSTPRLDSALEGRPHLVKINDWELAEFVSGPVDGPERLRTAAERLRERGAENVIVTRGSEPALVLHDGAASWLAPPRFDRGAREGCGDTMMGALAAGLALGHPWEETLVTGAAAGAVNFLRHGLGSGSRPVIEEIAAEVELQPFD